MVLVVIVLLVVLVRPIVVNLVVQCVSLIVLLLVPLVVILHLVETNQWTLAPVAQGHRQTPYCQQYWPII